MRPSRVFTLGLIIVVIGGAMWLIAHFFVSPESLWEVGGKVWGSLLLAIGALVATSALFRAQEIEEGQATSNPDEPAP